MAERTDVEILTAAADRLERLAAATTPTSSMTKLRVCRPAKM